MKRLFSKIIEQVQSKLIWKLFIVLLLNLCLVAVVGFIVSKDLWENALKRYVIDLEESLVDDVVDYWEDYYEEKEKWPAELKDPKIWSELMLESFTQDSFSEIYFFLRTGFFKHVSILDSQKKTTLSSSVSKIPLKKSVRPGLNWTKGPKFFEQNRRLKKNQQDKYISFYLEDFLTKFDSKTKLHYKQAPIEYKDKIVGWVKFPSVLKKQKNSQQIILQFWISRLGLIFLPILITLAMSYWLSRWLLRPMNIINKGLRAVEKNNFDYRIDVSRKDELGKLAKSFNLMASQMAEFAASKRFWIATISHELRTPLAVLKGELEAIIDGVRPANRKNLLSLKQEIASLTKMVLSLQEIANYEQQQQKLGNKEQLQKVAVNTLVKNRVKRHQQLFDKIKLELIVSCYPAKIFVLADPNLINRAIDKILENSLAYTTLGPVVIKSRRIKGFWQLTIEDSAPGVKKEDLAKLFDYFYRAGLDKSKGSGLGLCICRSIIEAHKGQITAHQSKTGGLLITIKIKTNVKQS